MHIEKGRARADERFWRAVDTACRADGALLAAYVELEAAKTEREQRERQHRLAGVRARAAELRGLPELATSQARIVDAKAGTPGRIPGVAGLRHALLCHQPVHAGRAVSAAQLQAGIVEVHRLYQQADYDSAAQLLPAVINRLEARPSGSPVPAQAKAAAYLAAAKIATKLGDTGFALVAADRGVRLATDTDHPALLGIARYQVACALLAAGHSAEAELTAVGAADAIAEAACSSQAKDALSVRGALLLLMAIMTARRGDASAAQQYLRDAARLADQLGQDGNWLWTAFGPTNVAIHELAVHVALGDSRAAVRLGEDIDTDGLPAILRGRRSQVHLELGWAAVGHGDDSLAVLHLLEAERMANQAVSRNATAQTLITTLLARERKSTTPGLRALASRAGILP